MNIIIVAATEKEIRPLLDYLRIEDIIAGEIVSGEYENLTLEVLITGVGMVNTAWSLGKVLFEYYELALNFGIAGAFDKNLKIGETVLVVEDSFPEMGAENGGEFLSLKEIALQEENEIFKPQEEINPTQLKKVSSATVNTVHGDEASIQKFLSRRAVQLESMEGAAFMYACLKEDIPFMQVRSISNYIEKRNTDKWDIPLAIKSLNETAINILDGLAEK